MMSGMRRPFYPLVPWCRLGPRTKIWMIRVLLFSSPAQPSPASPARPSPARPGPAQPGSARPKQSPEGSSASARRGEVGGRAGRSGARARAGRVGFQPAAQQARFAAIHASYMFTKDAKVGSSENVFTAGPVSAECLVQQPKKAAQTLLHGT